MFYDGLFATDNSNSIGYVHNNHYSNIIEKAKQYVIGNNPIQLNNTNNTALQSIFNKLQKYNTNNFCYDTQTLTITTNMLPKTNAQITNFNQQNQQFIAAYHQLSQKNASNVLALIQYYFSYTPCGYQGLEDISLYQFAKTTAGIAIALEKADNNELLFIGGDLSGIQDYIYNINAKSASKNLKGRSFYLHVLVSTVIETILKELNIPRACVVYQSGGGFYLIAPHSCKNKIKDIKDNLTKELYKTHQHQLYLALGYIPIQTNELIGASLSEAWKKLGEQLNQDKRRKFVDKFDDLFTPQEVSKEYIDCCTGQEISQNDLFPLGNDDNENDDTQTQLYVSTLTKQIIELGGKLKDAVVIVLVDENGDYSILDKSFCVFNKDEWSREKHQFNNATITVLNDVDLFKEIALDNYIVHFDYYGGSSYPVKEEDNHAPKSFSDLVGNHSFKRLGVLRMDVDNLGQCFINGFTDNRKTLARYSMLSHSLDVFFKGYINTIREKPQYRDWINIIYAGGDDLFIVGRWDITISFAKELKDEFTKYVAHNPHLTVSGGMAIIKNKFPIHRAAELAGNFEEAAKKHSITKDNVTKEKNSFDFFGMPLSWDFEFELVKERVEKLRRLINSNCIKHSYLEKISILYEMKNNNPDKLNWMWMLVYDTTRNSPSDKQVEAKKITEEIKNEIINTARQDKKVEKESSKSCKYEYLDIVALACRWVELEDRTIKKEYSN